MSATTVGTVEAAAAPRTVDVHATAPVVVDVVIPTPNEVDRKF
jgi:hypothetical protein